jgi:hypothetical protein
MSEVIEVRKLPKNTKIIFAVLVVFSISIFYLVQNTLKQDTQKILYNLGYKNISNLKVYSKNKVEDKETRIQGFKYFVKFNNLQNNKKCVGFILKDFKRKLAKNINCVQKGNK